MSNYEFDIKYINTSSFGQADVLSRIIANYPRPEEDILIANICTETDCYINTILQTATDQLPITKAEISEWTPKDEVLRKISDHTKNGWPQKCTDPDLSPYFPKRREILEIDGCLLYGKRVIVPTKLRELIIKALHMAHPGIVRMKALARQHVYWPGLDLEIDRMVRQCEACQSAQKSPPKAPLAPWTSCSRPFQRTYHPQSNGQAERFVDTFKRAMKKCAKDGKF